MPRYQSTLSFLYDLQLFGIKAGLDNIRSLVTFLGNPHLHYPVVHVAGTNGKGSTSSMIAAILTASGFRTGLYTSPHLVRFNERIRIDGKPISDQEIVRYTEMLRETIKLTRSTFFEATTAMAFQYFADKNVDVAVIETGLGGRWDATNVVLPLVSVITNIGLEHTEYLGTTLGQIAKEKGGIIKPGIPCITGSNLPKVVSVFSKISKRHHAKLLIAGKISSVNTLESSLNGLRLNLKTPSNRYNNIHLSLSGEHQAKNLQLAVLTIEELRRHKKFSKISDNNIRTGLDAVQSYSGIKSRLEVLSHHPVMLSDVAHNPDGIAVLVSSLNKFIVGKVVIVFGVMKDKDYATMIKMFAPVSNMLIAVRPQHERARASADIVHQAHSYGIKAIDGKTVENGIRTAISLSKSKHPIVITGSHYVVGEALQNL